MSTPDQRAVKEGITAVREALVKVMRYTAELASYLDGAEIQAQKLLATEPGSAEALQEGLEMANFFLFLDRRQASIQSFCSDMLDRENEVIATLNRHIKGADVATKRSMETTRT